MLESVKKKFIYRPNSQYLMESKSNFWTARWLRMLLSCSSCCRNCSLSCWMRARCPDVSDTAGGFISVGEVEGGGFRGGSAAVNVVTAGGLSTGTRNEPVLALISRYFFLLASSAVPPGVVRLATTLASVPSGCRTTRGVTPSWDVGPDSWTGSVLDRAHAINEGRTTPIFSTSCRAVTGSVERGVVEAHRQLCISLLRQHLSRQTLRTSTRGLVSRRTGTDTKQSMMPSRSAGVLGRPPLRRAL